MRWSRCTANASGTPPVLPTNDLRVLYYSSHDQQCGDARHRPALVTKDRERFTRCAGDNVTPGAVTVVLSGSGWPPISVGDARNVFVEGHVDAPGGPPSLVPLVYESLTRRLGWDAREPWREL